MIAKGEDDGDDTADEDIYDSSAFLSITQLLKNQRPSFSLLQKSRSTIKLDAQSLKMRNSFQMFVPPSFSISVESVERPEVYVFRKTAPSMISVV